MKKGYGLILICCVSCFKLMAKEVRFDDNEIYNLISSFQMEIIEKKVLKNS